MFGATFGTLAVQSTVDAATKALGGDQRAWQIVVGIYAICGLILHLICFFGTKERCGSTSEKVKIHAKEEMRSLFTNKYWILAIMTILFVMFFTAFTGGAGLYFAKRCLRRHCLLCTICKLYVCYTNDFSFYCICSDEKMGEEKYIDDWIDDYGNRNWYSVYLGK